MANESTVYIAPGLPQDLTHGTISADGTTPPLTPAQAVSVRKYGAKALMTGAAAAGVIALGGIVVVKIGKWLLFPKKGRR